MALQRSVMINLNILYVDDDDEHRAKVAGAISAAGHKVTQVSSGVQALALLRHEPYDCVVTDYHMPGVTDAAVAWAAREHQPYATICVVSGRARGARRELPSGTLLLTKPYSVPRLLDVLAPR
jgi:CheY-like chemotaxis protein